MNRRQIYLGVLLLLATLLTGGCGRKDPAHTAIIYAFGTLIELTVLGVDAQLAEQAKSAMEEDFATMHRTWHAWEESPLTRVNRLLPSGTPFAAPPSVLPLIERSTRLAEMSDHLFNPAIGRLIALWGFQGKHSDCHPPPAPHAIEKLLEANPRMTDLSLDGIMLSSRNPAVQLDFGAFGKGYGIDLAIHHLQEMGIRNAIVNAGGDLRAIGSRDGLPWRIAIRRPSGSGVFAILEVQGDESVFTSGDYERNFIYEGQRYHHIIDPRTGYPAKGTRSVTVVHPDAATADAAATALFVAGPKLWTEVARRMGLHYVLLVDTEGTLYMNPAMAERIELLERDLDIELSEPLFAGGVEGDANNH